MYELGDATDTMNNFKHRGYVLTTDGTKVILGSNKWNMHLQALEHSVGRVVNLCESDSIKIQSLECKMGVVQLMESRPVYSACVEVGTPSQLDVKVTTRR